MMRISEVHVFQRDLAVQGAYRMAHGPIESLDTTIVRVVTNRGVCGWGETCPVGPVYQPHHARGARAALAELAPGLIGHNPLAIDCLRTVMDERLNGHAYAKAAVDMALWDLAGRHYGARVCELLGGARTARVPSYYALSVGAPGDTARIAADRVAAGFQRLQIKVGGRPFEADIECIHAVHDAVGGRARLAVDANRSWTTRDALLVSSACARLPLILEQPCNTLEEVLAIRAQLHHPVYLDESADSLNAVLRAIASGACDGFGFKLTRAGGVSGMRTLREVCAARALPHSCDDAWGGDLVAAACVQVGATVEPRRFEGTWIAAPYIDGHYDKGPGISIDGGRITVPEGPGLGIDMDAAMLGTPVASYA